MNGLNLVGSVCVFIMLVFLVFNSDRIGEWGIYIVVGYFWGVVGLFWFVFVLLNVG